MSWFSVLDLNPQRRQARRMITNPQIMHAAVLSSFPPGTTLQSEEGRILWRLDLQGRDHRLYVVSPESPDLAHLVEQAGWATSPGQSASYTRFLEQLRIGQHWKFRLRANPVRSVFEPGKRGKVLPHVTASQQLGWLVTKAKANGFSIVGAPGGAEGGLAATVTSRQDSRFQRSDPNRDNRQDQVTLRQAQFDGVLEVTDAELLRKTLLHGMGRGKSYGCGLLTLQPV